MSVQAVEREALWLGGDERAAEALVHQNDGIHNRKDVVELAGEAQESTDNAA